MRTSWCGCRFDFSPDDPDANGSDDSICQVSRFTSANGLIVDIVVSRETAQCNRPSNASKVVQRPTLVAPRTVRY